LICPTRQVLAQCVLIGDRLLLCMGLFSIFSVGSQSDAGWLARSRLKPYTPARPPLYAEWRATVDEAGHYSFAVPL
jgi:hypothetical protein